MLKHFEVSRRKEMASVSRAVVVAEFELLFGVAFRVGIPAHHFPDASDAILATTFTLRSAREDEHVFLDFGVSPVAKSLRSDVSLLRCRAEARLGHFADSGIAGQDEITGVEGSSFKVLGVGRKMLPSRDSGSEKLNGAHTGEVTPQTLVVFLGGGKPDTIVGRTFGFLPKREDNLVPDVNCQAAKQGTRLGGERSQGIEDELIRNSFAFPAREEGVSQWAEISVAAWRAHDATCAKQLSMFIVRDYGTHLPGCE